MKKDKYQKVVCRDQSLEMSHESLWREIKVNCPTIIEEAIHFFTNFQPHAFLG